MAALQMQSTPISNNSDDMALFEMADDEDDDLDDLINEAETAPMEYRPTILPTPNIEKMEDHQFPDTNENFEKSDADIEKIWNTVSEIVLFEDVDQEQMEAIIKYFYVVKVKAGDVVIQQGDDGDTFYVVKSGHYQCERTEDGVTQFMQEYKDSGFFGDLALLYNAPRSASIIAKTDGEVWVLNAMRFTWVQKRMAMKNASDFTHAIRNLPLLRHNVEPRLLARVVELLEIRNYSAGSYICRIGDKSASLFFVLEGEIDVIVDKKVVDKLGTHDFFGERSLVLNEPRAASCLVIKKARVASLTRHSFRQIFNSSYIEEMKQYVMARYANEGETSFNIGGIEMPIDDE